MRICRKVARRTSLSFGVTILAMLLLISAGSAQQVTVYHWLRGSDANYNFIAAQIPEFERRNPDIKIELIHVIPATAHEQYMLAFATNMDIDVLWTNPNENLQHYMTSGWLLPMDDLVEKVGLDLGDFYPSIVDLARWEGNLYGIPYAALPAPALIYNPSMFDQVGLAYPDPNWTYENEFRDAARRLTRDVNGDGVSDIYGFSRPVHGDTLTILAAFGGRVLSADGTQVLVDSPGTIRALEFMDAMVNEYGAMRAEISAAPFRAGQQGMVFDAYWSLPAYVNNVDPGAWRVTMPPSGPEGRYMVFYNGYYSIARQSKNPEAAMRWIQYLVSEEVAREWIRANLNPTAHAAVNADPEFVAAEHHRAWIDLYSVPVIEYTMPANFRVNEAVSVFENGLTAILSRTQSIGTAVETMRQQLEAILAEPVR
ncbi:MAG: sugar ABC transporter substrate-binding protein [Firmicutes bacterium]|nr:sugar ABC transporter substrate-binding protein [Bacillota bacterium]